MLIVWGLLDLILAVVNGWIVYRAIAARAPNRRTVYWINGTVTIYLLVAAGMAFAVAAAR